MGDMNEIRQRAQAYLELANREATKIWCSTEFIAASRTEGPWLADMVLSFLRAIEAAQRVCDEFESLDGLVRFGGHDMNILDKFAAQYRVYSRLLAAVRTLRDRLDKVDRDPGGDT